MSTAIDMYLNQIALTGGIPFAVTLPQPPRSINMDLMTEEELDATFKKGLDDAKAGRVRNAAEAFAEFQRTHQ